MKDQASDIDTFLDTLLDRVETLETEIKLLLNVEDVSSHGRMFASGKIYAFEEEKNFLQKLCLDYFTIVKEGSH